MGTHGLQSTPSPRACPRTSACSSSAPASAAWRWPSSSTRPASDDFLVVERGSDVGGTWRDNTYPGAACDVPSQLYSYSFALNPDWSQLLLPAAGDPGLHPEGRRAVRHARPLRLRHRARGGDLGRGGQALAGPHQRRRADRRRRGLRRRAPSRTRRTPTSRASTPSTGEVFHSARWNHDYDLTGKRVAVIGTGASSIQIVPEIAEKVGAPRRLPAHRPVGDPAQRPRLHRRREARLQGTCPASSGSTARPSTGAARCTSRPSPRTRSWPGRPSSWPCRTSSAASTTPSCARRSPPTTRSAASAS